MTNHKLQAKFNNVPALLFITAIVSCLLSYINLNNPSAIINNDGILYIRTASAYLELGVHGALAQYKWPFYSIVIALLHKLLGISLPHAALLFNSLALIIICVCFVAIACQFTQCWRIRWFAVLTIVLFHSLNSLRADILRDYGYWLFYMLALYCFVMYCGHRKRSFAVLWSLFSMAAFFFRLEGALFLALAPLIIFTFTELSFRQRCLEYIKFNLPAAILTILAFAGLLMFKKSFLHELPSMLTKLSVKSESIFQHFLIQQHIVTTQIAGGIDRHSATVFLVGGLIAGYLSTIVLTLTPLYSVLSIFAIKKRLLPKQNKAYLALWFYIAINLLATAKFYMGHTLLSHRYHIPLCFVLMLWVPFALNFVVEKYKHITKYRYILILVSLCLLEMLFGSVMHFGTSKHYIKAAGQWSAKTIPAEQTILTNSWQYYFYTNRNVLHAQPPKTSDISYIFDNCRWKNYNYVAIVLSRKQRASIPNLKRFFMADALFHAENKRHDSIYIYKVTAELQQKAVQDPSVCQNWRQLGIN